MSVKGTKLNQGLSFNIESDDFTVMTDVSTTLGGNNKAPNPHQYLEIALASCTAITVQMYAKRKKIPLDYSDVSVKITAEGAINEFLREIKFVGEKLTQAEKDSLFAIAEKCPVHKFLSAGAKINTRIM